MKVKRDGNVSRKSLQVSVYTLTNSRPSLSSSLSLDKHCFSYSFSLLTKGISLSWMSLMDVSSLQFSSFCLSSFLSLVASSLVFLSASLVQYFACPVFRLSSISLVWLPHHSVHYISPFLLHLIVVVNGDRVEGRDRLTY